MSVEFPGQNIALRRVLAVVLSLMLALTGFGAPTAGQAQQLPNTVDQFQRSFGAQGQTQPGTNAAAEQGPQSMMLQPAVPQFQPVSQPSRLEQILSARVGVKLQQFGYDQFGRGRSVSVPQTGAVQDDYVLGSGDSIIVSLRGQENGSFNTVVDRNGQVSLPRLPPIAATGRSFGNFREDLNAAVRRAYVGTDASVSIGRIRQISVLVSGEVNEPGQRLLTGLSSAVDALLLSGGVKKTGTLRNVRILRGGQEYPIDLYNVLTDQSGGSGMRLADGDHILVAPLGATVAITGLVRRPGIYELPPRTQSLTARALLALAGGREVRGRYRLSLLRVQSDGRTNMVPLERENEAVRDSEVLFVQLGADQITSQATLSGDIELAGTYPIVTGTRLSEVLRAPGALGKVPYTPFGIIVRRDPLTLMRSVEPFTPVGVLAGREDLVLQSDDLIRVLSVNEAQLLSFVVQSYLQTLAKSQTAIRNPLGQTQGSENSLARAVASQSGQNSELQDISAVPADVQRREITALLDTAAPGSDLAQRQAETARMKDMRIRQSANGHQSDASQAVNTQAQPTQRQPEAQSTDQNVQLPFDREGQPIDPNVQSNELLNSSDASRNFMQLAVESNRYASNREVQTFGQLARQLGVDPLILINFLVDRRARLDGAVRGPGYFFIGPNVSLTDLVQAAGGTVNWADESGVELISTAVDRLTGRAVTRRVTLPLRQGALAGYIVQPHDQLRFAQIFTEIGGAVTVQGEVRFPGTFPIMRGERMSNLLARAGGLTNTAYPYGAVFLRQSAAQVEREGFMRAANEVQNQLVIAMTRVGNDKIDPTTFTSMQVFVSELRNQRALGRISVLADPSMLAANPSQDSLLESGDVIYIPPRPSTITVLGQVLQPGNFPYKAGESLGAYIDRAGGYSRTADESQTFLVLPDGAARRVERSWLSFSANVVLPPGSAIVVPRDATPLDLRQTIIDVSQVFSQFAVAIASIAVLSKQ